MKSTTLRGKLFFKENSLTLNDTHPILGIDPITKEVTQRTSISTSGFVTSALPSAQILVGNGSGVATAVAMTGVIAITNAGVTSIVDNSITNADINSSAGILYSKLNLTGGITNSDVALGAAVAYSKLALTGSIQDSDVAVGAAIARTKLASGGNYKIVVNNATGVLAEATITPSMAIVADSNGLPTASATSAAQIGYSSTLTGPIQAQLDTQIAGHTTAALLQSPTASENGFAITWNDGSQEWELTDPVIQGIPTGGATGTVLMKDSGTDYDASWTSLTLSDVSDVTADVDDVNLLTGAYTAGVTPIELTYLLGTTSAIQSQINLKLDKALTENYLFIGNSSNVAIPFAPGPDTYALTSVGGVPTWTAPSSGGTVTSVQVAGGTTGLTFTGGPVTTSGTITMAGTLAIANGGTGLTTLGTAAQQLRVNAGATALEYFTPSAGITGLTAGRVTFASSATTISDSSRLLWDGTESRLSVGGMGLWSDHDTTGNDNFLIAFGSVASVTGSDNFSFIGLQALTSGNRNIAIGNTSGQAITDGNHNILLGGAAGGSIVSGSGNVIIGDYAGILATGNNNIIFGWTAGDALTTGSSNFIVGTEVDAQSATASNQMTLQNAIFGQGNSGTGTTVSSGVIGLYSTAAIGSWQKATFVGNVGVESTAIANGVVLYAKDSSDGATNSTLALYCEQAPEATGTFTQTHRMKIWINGVEYWISLDAV